MPALNRTVSFAHVANIPILVSRYLYFYMSWLFYKLFHVNAIVLKRSGRFRFGCIKGLFHILVLPNYPHTFPASTRGCFKYYRVTHIIGKALGFIDALQ